MRGWHQKHPGTDLTKGFFCDLRYFRRHIMHVLYLYANGYFAHNNQETLDEGRVARQGIRAEKDRATQTLFPHEQVQTSPNGIKNRSKDYTATSPAPTTHSTWQIGS